MSDRLRPLWDFDDLDGSAQRFRAQLELEESDVGRAEVLTQLARVHGLREDFSAGESLLREAEALTGDGDVARVRIDLERGRLRRSSGDPQAALPLFEAAYSRALEQGENYLAGDAAHMLAIATPEKMEEWTRRGLELAESHPEAAYWAGPLLNNLGWHYFEAADYASALEAFERALAVRLRDPENQEAIQWAREAVEEARQALDR
jgi:tetratricopeptide (TPR) repeat protein